jgi:hypothetical protein
MRSISYTGKIILDMIPTVYDTERILRITGTEGEDKLLQLNQVTVDQNTGESILLNDLRFGKYDVMPIAGASHQSKRSEIAASMLDFMQFVPAAAPIVAPKLAEVMDWPGASEIAQELKAAFGGGDPASGPPANTGGSPPTNNEVTPPTGI